MATPPPFSESDYCDAVRCIKRAFEESSNLRLSAGKLCEQRGDISLQSFKRALTKCLDDGLVERYRKGQPNDSFVVRPFCEDDVSVFGIKEWFEPTQSLWDFDTESKHPEQSDLNVDAIDESMNSGAKGPHQDPDVCDLTIQTICDVREKLQPLREHWRNVREWPNDICIGHSFGEENGSSRKNGPLETIIQAAGSLGINPEPLVRLQVIELPVLDVANAIADALKLLDEVQVAMKCKQSIGAPDRVSVSPSSANSGNSSVKQEATTPDNSVLISQLPDDQLPSMSALSEQLAAPLLPPSGSQADEIPSPDDPHSPIVDDALPAKRRKLSPSRVKAKSLYEWASSEIDNIDDMTIVELFDAIELHPSEASQALPPNAETFGRYLRDAGVKKYSSRRNRPKGKSIQDAGDL